MRRRILVSTLIVVTITVAVLGGPLALTTWRLVEDFTRADINSRLRQVVATLDAQGSADRPVDLSAVGIAVPPGGSLVVRTPRGVSTLGQLDPGPTVSETLPFGLSGSAVLSEPITEMRARQLQATALVLAAVLLSVAVGAVVATLTARRLADPLQQVAGRAARLGAGDFRPAPHRHGIPELDRVSDVLDSSATALAELVQRERELVGDVSHQLRSRLTALQLRLDELSAHPDEHVSAEGSAALEQAERLAEVLDELLASAREARAAGAAPIEVAGELDAVADEWRDPLRSEGRTVRVRTPEGLVARATSGRLREALGVLVDNAMRHGKGTVTLTARLSDNDTIVIEVGDHGDGVPPELAPHVFDRGVSGAASTGVGLALARALIEADGGRLELARTRPATFSVFLPVPRTDRAVAAPRPLPTTGPR
ncbi:signal transduction histidine kinase [Actinomycetospora succinea]|uniref:Signal transduction histidine-protein kinase/phosphatase MprB n=1 Tax=Actinomycetospora succinea TaxID=663603 RepID=A0A4R6VMF7_9PSEU|nr:ATP-binding protein [Actinomycetospora succinea]TDQ64959.1 signal transduction histidine kinase [Actinomycetospora succinea]